MKRNNFDLNKSCEEAIEDEEQEASEEEQENENISFEPFIGQYFLSEEEAYLFYHKYAKQYGFSICKARFDKNKDGVIKRRDFVCHREEVVDVVSETEGESNIFEDANLADPVYCPPKSKNKGRPKSKRSKGGKEVSKDSVSDLQNAGPFFWFTLKFYA
ncbi:hypothetical protein AgCh_024216 [Apium graveolens]